MYLKLYKMRSLLLSCFVIYIFLHCAEGATRRDKRSPQYGHGPGPPPPMFPPPPPPMFPPPPPHFRSRQWTGFARSSDGGTQGVFSGAEASAGNYNGGNNGGSAYSLASSSSGSNNENCDHSEGQASQGYGQQNTGGSFQAQTKGGYNGVKTSNNQVNGQRGDLGRENDEFSSKYTSGNNNQIHGQQPSQFSRAEASSGAINNNQQQQQSNAGHSEFNSQQEQFGSGQAQTKGGYNGVKTNEFSAKYTSENNNNNHIHSQLPSQFTQAEASSSTYNNNNQQQQQSNAGHSGFNSQQKQFQSNQESSNGRLQYQNNNQVANTKSLSNAHYTNEASSNIRADTGSALNGALNLASEGIQAGQHSPCTTCNKGGYALSNARSNSGSAVAVSIG